MTRRPSRNLTRLVSHLSRYDGSLFATTLLPFAEPGSQDPAPPPKPASTTTFTATPEATTAVENAELAKRQARAARFGIPLVEPEKQLPDVCIP